MSSLAGPLAFMLLLAFSTMYYRDSREVPSLHLASSDFYAVDILVDFLTRKVMSPPSWKLSFLYIGSTF